MPSLADGLTKSVSEEDAFRQMSPFDQLRPRMPSNFQPVSPEQASVNKGQNLRDLLSIIPGPGNVIAAEDASQAFVDAAGYAQEGRYGRSALSAALGTLSGFGAVTGLPTSRMAGNAARGASTAAPAFPAWHGSPHDFDEFKLDKIGTGEGAQAYGHGLYFAENPAVAKKYRDDLSASKIQGSSDPAHMAWDDINYIGDEQTAVATWKNYIKDSPGSPAAEAAAAKLAAYEKGDVAKVSPGRLYHTEIDAEPHQLLDWDVRFEQQPQHVQEALKRLPQTQAMLRQNQIVDQLRAEIEALKSQRMTPEITQRGGELQRRLLKEAREAERLDNDFHDFRKLTGSPESSAALREAGIPGIRYLDQGSRGADGGTSNYVIFDDKLTKILSKE